MTRKPSNDPRIPPEPHGRGRQPSKRKRERMYVDGHVIDADIVTRNYTSRHQVRQKAPENTQWEDGHFKCTLNGTSWVMVDDLVNLWGVSRAAVIRCLLNPIASKYLKAKREKKDMFHVEHSWYMDKCDESPLS